MDRIIEVSGLKKSFGSIEAVKGIDFYVERGSLFAFLGPNGAGKSTTINIIGTLLKPDAGKVIIDGYELGRDDDKIRSVIGMVFQEHVLDDLLTIRENMIIRGSFYYSGKKEIEAAVIKAAQNAGVMEYFDRPYEKLSGGQKRRADIARALVNTPKILILDEPTTGLDPQTRQNVWETVEYLRKENNMTIFLTTHYMEEAAKADYVVIIDEGAIVAKGTPAQLKEQYSADHLIIHTDRIPDVIQALKPFGLPCETRVDTITVRLESTMQSLPMLEACRDMIRGFQVIEGSMDDVFINITGKEIRE
ncbi:MAG TPA: ABC transporter ATP-binding protein [Clostridiales bacterium]|nr:ABC transporter ATP-binding protein [Clostridiales bacterium]